MLPSHVIAITEEVVSVVLVDETTVIEVVVRAFSINFLVVGVIADKIVDDIVVVDNGIVFVISVELVVEVTSDNVVVNNDVIVFIIVVVIVEDVASDDIVVIIDRCISKYIYKILRLRNRFII